MKILRGNLRMCLDELGLVLAAVLAGPVIGGIIQYFISRASEESVGGIMTLLSLMLGAVCLLFMGIFTTSFHFQMMVEMGRTRKEFMVNRLIISWIMAIAFYALSFVVYIAEKSWYRVLEMDFGILFKPVCMLGIIFVITGTGAICEAVIIRFGSRAKIVLWCLWMVMCLAPTQLVNRIDWIETTVAGKNIIQFLAGLDATQWSMLGMVCGLVFYVACFLIYRKQEA